MKLCFENLAKLLRVAYFPHRLSLCPASFCFTALRMVSRQSKEGRGKEKHISEKYVFFLLGKGWHPTSGNVNVDEVWFLLRNQIGKLWNFSLCRPLFTYAPQHKVHVNLSHCRSLVTGRQGKKRCLALDYPRWANWHKLWKTPKQQEYHSILPASWVFHWLS